MNDSNFDSREQYQEWCVTIVETIARSQDIGNNDAILQLANHIADMVQLSPGKRK